ncbi:transcription initiation factor IIA subunit 2 [Acipenser oxyrinchus oxyrinchus]|uniref:Transcription initiation factor IIA gamma chain n=1 Tax=Acipenser oxyrinchus oxyrinchus TaxID=40147 RepID=A0AAD8CEX5_ACIOX|nr:transcription initiation factor IIA subunit 2 [Acipenser oxyrinchus oxyrinchus]
MAYQLYRNTTLGNSLQESLDELIQSQQITPQLALQVLLQFDKAINTALAQRVRNRVNFRVSVWLPNNDTLCSGVRIRGTAVLYLFKWVKKWTTILLVS